MDETWLPVVGYEGLYEVSDAGRVRSLARLGTRGTVLRPDNKTTYPSVRLSKDGRKKHLNVHRLVATAFHGPAPEGYECRHLNGDPTDNRAVNLRWGTSAENSADIRLHGRNAMSNKTHCPQGHAYDEANTQMYQGRRYCRACNRVATRESARRRRAKAKESA